MNRECTSTPKVPQRRPGGEELTQFVCTEHVQRVACSVPRCTTCYWCLSLVEMRIGNWLDKYRLHLGKYGPCCCTLRNCSFTISDGSNNILNKYANDWFYAHWYLTFIPLFLPMVGTWSMFKSFNNIILANMADYDTMLFPRRIT